MPMGIYIRTEKIRDGIRKSRIGKKHTDETKQKISKANIGNKKHLIHGMANSIIYGIWKNMKNRCYNKKVKAYKNYGGRGITVCERWLNKETGFINFYRDMGDKPEGLTLDRINNNGNYEPNNCRWATRYEQIHNRRKAS